MALFEELKRRNVVRVAVLYVVAGWIVLQVADVLFENLDVPGWAFRLVLGLLVLGFPLALIFSWVFEITPEGIKREKDIDRNQSITARTGQRMNRMIIGLLVLVIVAMAGERWLLPGLQSESTRGTTATETVDQAAPATAADERTLAVLPFVNMSGDEENEYFSDGLSEELLNSLARIPELQVTGRTSSFAFKDRNEDLREIGEKLNVAHVLEGSVRKAGDQVRITAQLINTGSGYHLWSETYDRKLDDIFAIQSDIAERVAAALSITLLGGAEAPQARDTESSEAYEAYLRGRHVFQRRPDDPETLDQARAYYEKALELDQDYLQAWYGMFQYWSRRHRNGIGSEETSIAEMQAVADRVKAINPESEIALLTEARMQLLNLNWPAAIELYSRQIERFPGSIDSWQQFATSRMLSGDLPGAIEAFQHAVELDPLSLETLALLSVPQYMLGDCKGVRQTMERVLELQADYGRVRGALGYCLLMHSGDIEEAMQWLELEPAAWMKSTGLAIAYHRIGEGEQASRLLEQMMQTYDDGASFQYAQVYTQWSDYPSALQWLERAFEVIDPGVIQTCIDPFVRPLQDQPGFESIISRTGFDSCPDATAD